MKKNIHLDKSVKTRYNNLTAEMRIVRRLDVRKARLPKARHGRRAPKANGGNFLWCGAFLQKCVESGNVNTRSEKFLVFGKNKIDLIGKLNF